jgi:5-methylcytosine-specific restriction endonuclease McrA
LHHKVAKSAGGGFTLANIVPLHRTCHEGVTHAGTSWFC